MIDVSTFLALFEFAEEVDVLESDLGGMVW
jgi:hypothetical protein